jgi:sugar phosphate isomerase/epimerase
MKIAFCSISALDRPLGEAARVAAAAGADGLEITERPPHLAAEPDPAAAREAGARVRAAGLEVVAFGSYLGREAPARPDAAARAAACAAAMEAPLLRVWAEPAAGGDDRDRVISLLRAACDAAAPLGVTVVVERHVDSYVDTPERVERFLADVDRENFALNYQVLDLIPAAEADAQPADATRLAPLARYFHLKNFRGSPGRAHLLPGGSLAEGALDYRAILSAALRAGYAGPLAVEFLSFEPKPLEEKLSADVRWLRDFLARLDASACRQDPIEVVSD